MAARLRNVNFSAWRLGFLGREGRGSGARVPLTLRAVWGPAVFAGFVIGAAYWIIETALHTFVFRTGTFEHELIHGGANEIWMRSLIALLFVVLGAVVQWHQSQSSALTLRARRLASAIEQAGEAVMITDADGRIEFANPAFSRFTGYTLDEVRGKNPSVLKSGAHSQNHYGTVWATITSGRVWSGSIVDRRKDGTFYPALLTIAPITDERGVITHFVGVQHDLTRQIELEERIRQAERLEALGTFASGIAHDFNNTLSLLSLQLELTSRHPDSLTAPVRADLVKLEKLVHGAAASVRELNDFARRGITNTARAPLELRQWLDDVFPMVRPMIPETVQMTLILPSHAIWVAANDAILQQVIINLLQNARDAIADRPGGAITLSCEPVGDGRAQNPDAKRLAGVPCAWLRVRDNGPGLAPALLDRIFEPFFTTKGERGTGLGLAMARDAVHRHGGAIRAVSTPGAGATFELLLPIISPPEKSDAAENRAR